MAIWQDPTDDLRLTDDRVHIWRANLNLPQEDIEGLIGLLSADELARANKFRFAEHRNSFIASRGILRQLLANYLDLSPKNLEFGYSDRGKPLLAKANLANIPLQFNVSHSHEYALFGFTWRNLIGVDIEYLREMKDAVKIARRFFSEREFKFISSFDLQQQPRVFFKHWTAKEAYLKAIGVGLTGSLASIEIALDRAENASIIAIDDNKATTTGWSMYSCSPASDYVGAIAIQTQITKQQIDFWNWS